MSAPTTHPDRRATREGGFTLLEAVIVAALMAILIGSVTEISISSSKAQTVASIYSRATAAGKELLDEMRHDLVSSTTLFAEGALADKYLDMIQHADDLPIEGSILPTADDTGIFEKETNPGDRTGNSLLLARHEWTEQVTATSGKVYAIDVYKIVYWFLTEKKSEGTDVFADLTIRQFVSEPLADGGQIDDIATVSDRIEVQQALRQTLPNYSTGREAVELVWLRGEDPSVVGTMRYIDEAGRLVDRPRGSGTWQLQPDSLNNSETFLNAYDSGIATNDAPARYGVARFAKKDDRIGFPHGFELQIVGPPSARRALVHINVMVSRGGDVAVVSDQSAVTHFSEV